MAKTTVPIELSSTPSIVDNGNATAITIDSSENVGIGTGSPQARLHVSNGSAGIEFGPDGVSDGTSYIQAYDRVASSFDNMRYYAATHSFYIEESEKLTIDSSGNVGIGTSSPSRQLHLSNSSDHGIIAITGGTSNLAGIVLGDTADDDVSAVLHNNSGNYLYFTTSTTERMRITSGGFAKMSNNNGDYYSAGGSYHEIRSNQNGYNNVIMSHNGNSTPYGPYIVFTGATPDDNVQYFLACGDSTTTRVIIYSDGDFQNHDNSYGGISDEKLKQDITDAGSQWDDIKNLRVRNFKFKSDVEAYGDDAKTKIGLVAQEAELVTPHLVKDNPDLDEEHNDLGTVTKSIKYSVLYMKAIKALQEAMTRIEDLEARITALEGN